MARSERKCRVSADYGILCRPVLMAAVRSARRARERYRGRSPVNAFAALCSLGPIARLPTTTPSPALAGPRRRDLFPPRRWEKREWLLFQFSCAELPFRLRPISVTGPSCGGKDNFGGCYQRCCFQQQVCCWPSCWPQGFPH